MREPWPKRDEGRVSAYGAESADRGVDSSGDELLGSLLQFAGLFGLTGHGFDAPNTIAANLREIHVVAILVQHVEF